MRKQSWLVALVELAAVALVGCGKEPTPGSAPPPGPASQPLASSGQIKLDGSSTLLPLSEAVAEDFQKQRPSRVTVGASGTGGGFQKFCSGEIDVAAASTPIKASEADSCAAKGVTFLEVAVAYDAVTVVVNPQNSWVDFLTVDELKRMWEPGAQQKVTRWSQIREGWPDEELRLFGAGVDSGTYDYFTKAVVGTEHASRGDYTSSEDDNVLVQGVSTDKLALGFFGFSYFEENAGKLRVVPIDDAKPANGPGPVAPSTATVLAGTYQPLARPLFVYFSVGSLKRPEVAELAAFYVDNAARLSKEVGFIPLSASTSAGVKRRFEARTEGSLFRNGSVVDVHLDALLSAPPSPESGSGAAAPK